MDRRQFIQLASIAGGGCLVSPVRSRAAGNAANDRLNIALIGAWGRASAHYAVLSGESVSALCDVNENNLGQAVKKFPGAKTYVDWRKCLDQKGLDAVVICTADHHHAFIANWSINRGLHVFCEKPLGITVEEARVVRANFLKNRSKLATQHGTQRHAYPNFQRLRELVLDGAVGELKSVSAWDSRKNGRPGYPPAEGEAPPYLNWDQWIGPSPFHPYNPDYFSAPSPGMNCLRWNPYSDFGVGQMGDMGSHTMDLVWNVIDAGAPVSAEASGDPFSPDVCPVELKAVFEHPANKWRPAINVVWYQGGLKPEPPKPYINLEKIGNGAIFEGSKGVILADFSSRIVIPSNTEGDMTYYKRRTTEQLLPLTGGTGPGPGRDVNRIFMEEWIGACKGDHRTSCDFDYAGTMMEQMILGLVAHRAGKKLQYDAAAGCITNVPEANAFLTRKYRPGWTLNG